MLYYIVNRTSGLISSGGVIDIKNLVEHELAQSPISLSKND